MKVAPLIRAFESRPESFQYRLVHTGQHYDREMSEVFFDELGIPLPNARLGCGGGSHAVQTANVMIAFEKELLAHPTDLVLVVGDVNSTLACALVASKLQIKVAHFEAGLRSGDRRMPEEINRLATDAISDLFFVTEPSGQENLLREGHNPKNIHFVGHVMIDNLYYQLEKLKQRSEDSLDTSKVKALLRQRNGRYATMTLHRPSNVDSEISLKGILGAINVLAEELPIAFAVHPRTRANIEKWNIEFHPNVRLLKPLSYMEFLNLWKDAACVFTDSGGLQEETTGLGVQCITLRDTTERPITIKEGTNTLAGINPQSIISCARTALTTTQAHRKPLLWDGKAADRLADVLVDKSSAFTVGQVLPQ